ncbi:MAG: Fic family protein [Dongiaceae bacterium]
MPVNLLNTLPEVFVSATDTSLAVSRGLKIGKLRKLGSRLYTRNLTDPAEQIVRRHLWQLVASYVPGALIADRTAIENAPASDGSIFVIANRKRNIELLGIVIRPRKGIAPLETDRAFVGDLRLSSLARAYLENMTPSRRRASQVSRTLSRKEIEGRLETMLRRGGAEALNRLRDQARQIAPSLQAQEAFAALDKLIGAVLGTWSENLLTPEGRARRAGLPFDPDRILLFEKLHAELRNGPSTLRLAPQRKDAGHATLAFFEAYFSNFIEGTEFEVAEAADIVFRGVIPRERPEDAHDILGTWRLVSDRIEMTRTPTDATALLDLLRYRHAAVMAARPDKRPGEFKIEGNRSGNTIFVVPELVRGTLERGFEIFRSLGAPFQRAVFMMFLISEVHPFADGNGRVARIMMNAELIASGEERVVFPTIYRSNYLATLKALSQVGHTEPLTRMLDFAQKWTAAVPWGEFEHTHRALTACNAFVDPNHADAAGIRLRLPDADAAG